MKLIHSRRELFAGIGLLVVALGINAALGFHFADQLHDDWMLVAHTYEVLDTIETLNLAIVDAETGQRGFLLTGEDEYLKPYESALAGYQDIVQRLGRLTSDNPRQVALVPQLDHLLSDKFQQLKKSIDIRRNKGVDAAQHSPALPVGRKIMDDVRAILDQMRREEKQLLVQRDAENNRAYYYLRLSGLLGLGLSFIAVGGFQWLLRRYIRTVGNSAARIHEQRELLHATLISIGDGVIATDRAGKVTLLNSVAEALTGWDTASALNQPLDKIFHIVNEDTRQVVDNPALRALREGKIMGLANHTILISRDGSECPIDDSAAPVRNSNNEISGAVLVFREIRERKQHEAELLRQATALQEADRRKDEFLAILAHELRNPLSPLSNALQIWPMISNDPAQLEQLRQMMERQVGHMTRLIDDLLDVSRITRGKIELRKQMTDLATLISGAMESLQPMIAAAEQEVAIAPTGEPLWIEGDVARLTQVFWNILHNAVKYTGRKGRIRVSAERRDDKVFVSIADNGPGIPREMLSRIFDMFQQVDTTLERSHGGLGIGLTLVKRLVELHGGSVEARSGGANQGSEFIVSLPAADAAKAMAATAKGTNAASQRLPRLRVLVVDDVEASARTLGLMLDSIGQEVSIVNDGPAAISRILADSPDVVFMDIGMPGMNGYDAAREIRKNPNLANVFLVALTGYGQEEDRRRASEAGFNHHMTKPTSIAALEQLLMTRPFPHRDSSS